MKPIHKGFAFIIEIKKASVFCPESVLPAASMIVPEIIKGNFLRPEDLKKLSYAKMAALAFKVSKIVSIKIKWVPPSTRP